MIHPEQFSHAEKQTALSQEALAIVEVVWNQAIERLSPSDPEQRQQRQARGKPTFERNDPNLYKRLIGAASGTVEFARAAQAGKTVDLGGYINRSVVDQLTTIQAQPELFNATSAQALPEAALAIAQSIGRRANESLEQLSGESLPLLKVGQTISVNFDGAHVIELAINRVTGSGEIVAQAVDPDRATFAAYVLGYSLAPEQLGWNNEQLTLTLNQTQQRRYIEYQTLRNQE